MGIYHGYEGCLTGLKLMTPMHVLAFHLPGICREIIIKKWQDKHLIELKKKKKLGEEGERV